MIIERCTIASPVGPLTLAAADGKLLALSFGELWERRERALLRLAPGCRFVEAGDPAGAVTRLARYFAGDFAALDDLVVESHGTPFQRSVWRELRRIPPGRTRSYGEIAAAIGSPSAVRAVGAANGANPVGIVVPCHRVIGSDGTLTGFAGGLAAKRWLLAHEGALPGGEATMPLFAAPAGHPAASAPRG